LKLIEGFGENGRLNDLCNELDKISQNTDFDLFDVFISEKILTEILENFAFLARYKIISIHDIKYHHIKQSTPVYIQHHFSNYEEKKNKARDEPSNSYAIFLQNKSNDNDCLNLFPFVIDLNSWKKENTIYCFAFFNYYNKSENAKFLEYNILGNYDGSLKNFNRLYHRELDSESKYATDNLEQHTTNAIIEAFEKILSILTGNESEQ
jgi:hypothetical protein